MIETALGAGLLATDGSGKPVALRYQPRNTSGAALLCSVQLLSYTALSTEEHRQALLAALLLTRGNDAGHRVAPPRDSAPDAVDPGHVATMLVALSAAGSADPMRLRKVAETFLQLSLDAQATETVLEHFEAEGVLARSEGERRVQAGILESALDALGLHACARELQEMVREHPEVQT